MTYGEPFRNGEDYAECVVEQVLSVLREARTFAYVHSERIMLEKWLADAYSQGEKDYLGSAAAANMIRDAENETADDVKSYCTQVMEDVLTYFLDDEERAAALRMFNHRTEGL